MGEMTLREALDEYKNVYMAYRNFADRTRVEYENDLENFIEFLEKSGTKHVKRIGRPIIERYVAYLEQKGFASLTRKRKKEIFTLNLQLAFDYLYLLIRQFIQIIGKVINLNVYGLNLSLHHCLLLRRAWIALMQFKHSLYQ